MDKFDQYKRLLRLGIAGIEIILEAAFFTYVWFGVYNGRRLNPFENKGNLMMVGFYILYLVVFIYMYGGTKYAYYRKGQLILSQTLNGHCKRAHVYADYHGCRTVPASGGMAHAGIMCAGIPDYCFD